MDARMTEREPERSLSDDELDTEGHMPFRRGLTEPEGEEPQAEVTSTEDDGPDAEGHRMHRGYTGDAEAEAGADAAADDTEGHRFKRG